MLLAQMAGNIGSWAVWLVIVAAIVALVMVGLKKFGIVVPDFVRQVIWIIVVALVLVFAIRFVMTL